MRDLKYILRYAKPYRKSITAAVLLVFAECIFEMAIPLLMTDIVDIGVANRDVAFLLRQGGLMILCAFLALATGLAYARFAASAANGLGAEIRAAEYKQTQKYDFANLDRFSALFFNNANDHRRNSFAKYRQHRSSADGQGTGNAGSRSGISFYFEWKTGVGVYRKRPDSRRCFGVYST